jgi:hypothetical protein
MLSHFREMTTATSPTKNTRHGAHLDVSSLHSPRGMSKDKLLHISTPMLIIQQRTEQTDMQEMNKFSNGKIYKVVSPNHPKVYYGSTINTLAQRMTKHRELHFSKYMEGPGCSSKEIIDAGDADIFEVEAFPCTCKEELQDREAEYILNDWEGCVNEHIPGAMRRAGGKKAYMKVYNATPEQKAKVKKYHQSPKGKASKKKADDKYLHTAAAIANRKAYYQRPDVKQKKKKRQQRPEVKAKMKARRAIKTPCNVCGFLSTPQNLSRHQKTKTCQKHLKTELEKVMEDIISIIENC